MALDNKISKFKVLCKRCKSVHTQRIKRPALIKSTLFWLPIKRYFCNKCNHRFYIISGQ